MNEIRVARNAEITITADSKGNLCFHHASGEFWVPIKSLKLAIKRAEG